LSRRLSGPQSKSGRFGEKSLPLLGFEPWVVLTVLSWLHVSICVTGGDNIVFLYPLMLRTCLKAKNTGIVSLFQREMLDTQSGKWL